VRIGKGKVAWEVRYLRPDLGQVGLVSRGRGVGVGNRYIEPGRVTVTSA
jgi:hypothetical protein